MMTSRPAVKDSLVTGSHNHSNEVLQEAKGQNSAASKPNIREQSQSKSQVESPIMGIQECSKFTGIAVGTLYKLTSQRKIPHSKPTKKVLFLKEDILSWIAANKVVQE